MDERILNEIQKLPTLLHTRNHWEWRINKNGIKYCNLEPTAENMVKLTDVLRILNDSLENNKSRGE